MSEPISSAPSVRWGVYDTQDALWIGNDVGPLSFPDRTTAQIAAQVAEDMLLGTDLVGRLIAKEIPNQYWQMRDELFTLHTPLESSRRIEGVPNV